MTEMLASFDAPRDSALDDVEAQLRLLDPDGARWAAVIRHTYDMIYNGQETGRYRWDQLMKTEKTHFGTLFEINAQRAFEFEGGRTTDFDIAGCQVDAKWSQSMGGWMLPPEVFGEIALVATGEDARSRWSLGLVRVSENFVRIGRNRDSKSTLNELGRASIRWLWREAALRPNVLLQLPPGIVEHIFNHASGAQRTNRLFREAEGMIINRNTVATVSRQLDAQKRVRYNGGARSALASEGIVILSGAYHVHLAAQLDVSIPRPNEYIAVRIVPTQGPGGALIEGQRWRRARPGEQIEVAAPRLPEPGSREE